MTSDGLADHYSFMSQPGYALTQSALFVASLGVVLLIGFTGAGTEGQPGLLASLCIVVGVFVLVGFLVAYSGWRLSVNLDGSELTVRRLRTRTIQLAQVESVTWHGWIDEAMVLTERSDEDGRPHRVTVPFSARVLYGIVEVRAWATGDAQWLLRAVFDELPPDVAFDERAAAPFIAAGCLVERET